MPVGYARCRCGANWRLSTRSVVNFARSQVYHTERPPYLFAARSPWCSAYSATLSVTAALYLTNRVCKAREVSWQSFILHACLICKYSCPIPTMSLSSRIFIPHKQLLLSNFSRYYLSRYSMRMQYVVKNFDSEQTETKIMLILMLFIGRHKRSVTGCLPCLSVTQSLRTANTEWLMLRVRRKNIRSVAGSCYWNTAWQVLKYLSKFTVPDARVTRSYRCCSYRITL